MKLTSEQVEGSIMALAFVQAILKGTDTKHLRPGCPLVIQEDGYSLDTEVIVKGTNASNRPSSDNNKIG